MHSGSARGPGLGYDGGGSPTSHRRVGAGVLHQLASEGW
jgi:hypothetical protein